MARPRKGADPLAGIDLELVEQCGLLGHTEVEIGWFLKKTKDEIRGLRKHQVFLDALMRGKEKADGRVIRALYQKATGFIYQEITEEQGKPTKTVTKYAAPDTGAAAFWLKNRKRKSWKDKWPDEYPDPPDPSVTAEAMDAVTVPR